LAPQWQVCARPFVQGLAGRIDHLETPAALQIGLNHAADLDRRLAFIPKTCDRNRHLGQSHAGDLDAELGQGRHHRSP
jgi:hypothetical protein